MSTATTHSLSTAAGTYAIDQAHTSIGFQARHAMVSKVRGGFTEFAGSFVIDGDDITRSTAELTIQAASITTRNNDRDAHLKSADFLDVENFPTLTFTSTSVALRGDDLVVTGDLTIHGVTKSVDVVWEFNGTSVDPYGNSKIGFDGKAKISRKEYGLTWNVALEAGGVMISDEITLVLEVEADKKA